ncbi:hypothetical protein MNBD_NITROSPINAE02-1007 [hydrothermal vent metagenome]|uniref:Outer membrane protein beta-barrel domain-containing protein n=1 Tax=hydrothermal vent metagenome TaxID=652676 RepID=A0A3B1CF51_9ZZZZ
MRLFIKLFFCGLLFSFFAPAQALAEKTVSFEAYSGFAYNAPTQLTVTEKGKEDVTLMADWETESFQDALYYGLRVGLWEGKKGWEIEFMHHKIKLTNAPEEIDSLEISHGYNLLTVNRAWELEVGYVHLGLGFVFTHPDLRLRGKERDHGKNGVIPSLNIAGPTMQASIGRRYKMSDTVYGFLEGKITTTYATIEYDDGEIQAPNIALHLVFGLGFDYFTGE